MRCLVLVLALLCASTAAQAQFNGCAPGLCNLSSLPNITYSLTSSIPGALTFTRASSGTYYNSSGILTTASTNVARFDTNPTTLAANGLLYETATTNYAEQSNSVGTTPWGNNATATAGAAGSTSPDGTNDAQTLTGVTNGSGWYQFGSPVGSALIFGLYVKYVSGSFILQLGDDTNNAVFNIASSVPTVSYMDGTGANAAVQSLPNGWYYLSVGITDASSYATLKQVSGSPPGVILSYGYQWANGVGIASYVATTTAIVTRAADNLSVPYTAGYNFLTLTFDDNSTQKLTLTGSPYVIPATSINRPHITQAVLSAS